FRRARFGEPEELPREAALEARAREKAIREVDHSFERPVDVGVDELSGRIDRLAVLGGSIAPDAIHLLPPEADWIELVVARPAESLGLVRFVCLARGPGGVVRIDRVARDELRDLRGRGRHVLAKKLPSNEEAADDGTRLLVVRVVSENARQRQ